MIHFLLKNQQYLSAIVLMEQIWVCGLKYFLQIMSIKGKGQNVENHFVESQKKNIESVKV